MDPTTFTGPDFRDYPAGRPLIFTTDEKDDEDPIKGFPPKEYLRQVTEIILREPKLLLDKSRQMMATTIFLLVMDWWCRFKPARRFLVSRSKEEDAVELLKDKVRAIHTRLPDWVQEALPQRAKPEKRVDYPGTRSYILAVAQNVAKGTGRGGSASRTLVDEAAYQDEFPNMVQAILPMSAGLWGITTAEVAGAGAHHFKYMIERPSPLVKQPEVWDDFEPILVPAYDGGLRGLSFRRTVDNFVVVTLDAEADEDKRSEAWHLKTKEGLTEKQYRREIRRDWATSAGDAFYPEFAANGGPAVYVRRYPGLIDGPIYRGWDFGRRKPAVVWLQYDPKQNRAWVFREWMPAGISVHTLRDVVLFLSGQAPLEALDQYALHWVYRIAADARIPEPPWFRAANALQWIDYSGPEANYVSDMPEKETQARTRAQVLAEAGIYLQIHSSTLEAGEDIVRRLLKIRVCKNPLHVGCKGHPGLLLDPSCTILRDALAGGLAYPKPTQREPWPVDPHKDGHYDNVHEALRRVLVNLIPVAEVRPPALPAEPVYRGRRRVSEEELRRQFEDLGWLKGLASRRW